MARLKRFAPAGVPQHIIQRGNNRQACFVNDSDMAAYASLLYEGTRKFDVAVHGWVFMTNHVHLLATPSEDDSLSRLLQSLGSSYVLYFNRAYGRSGTLFEGRFKSCPIQTGRYFLACLRYIEMNPVRAAMIKDPGDYKWSSYHANGFGRSVKLWTPHEEYLRLGNSSAERQLRYRQLFHIEIDQKLLSDIRSSVHSGLAFGSEKFKDDIEALGDRRQRLLKRGPKAKSGTE